MDSSTIYILLGAMPQNQNMKCLSMSTKIYVGLIAALVVIRVVLSFFPMDYIVSSQAAMSTWQALIIVAVLGFVGLRLSRRTGFPEIFDAAVSNRQRFLTPVLLGLASGILLLLLDLIQPIEESHVPFPVSVAFYAYGGIVSEILLRLFLIPLFLWLISFVLLRNRWQEQVFWGIAIVLSLLEPLGQIGAALQIGTLGETVGLTIVLSFAVAYGVNLLSAYIFRISGFLAPLIMRLSLYAVWHVIFGELV